VHLRLFRLDYRNENLLEPAGPWHGLQAFNLVARDLASGANKSARSWLATVALAWNHGFSPRELNEIRRVVVEHEPAIVEAWHEHCGQR
jgi:uncharacterized protein DUF4160